MTGGARIRLRRHLLVAACMPLCIILTSCASFSVPDHPSLSFVERAEEQAAESISVSAVILSDQEVQDYFSSKLHQKDIQPIWLRIDNQRNENLLLNPLTIDKDYYSPSEAAWQSRGMGERNTEAKVGYFYRQHIPLQIPPNSTVSGFVYSNMDPSAKSFTVQLLGEGDSIEFDYVMLVPGFEADFMRFGEEEKAQSNVVPSLDEQGLREFLATLPCCAKGGDNVTPGDPLNLVIVGHSNHVLTSLVRQGWDLTELLTVSTAWKTVRSSLFMSRYRTSPISPLYVFDRPQDAALQKVRQNVDERNHLRLWRAPVNYQETPVWVGQISRDIGVKLSSKTLVTHRIDPFVDEARSYLLLDLIESQYLAYAGYVQGVGLASTGRPRYNYTKDPYYTDGLRVVMLLSEEPLSYDQIGNLRWERLPPREVILN